MLGRGDSGYKIWVPASLKGVLDEAVFQNSSTCHGRTNERKPDVFDSCVGGIDQSVMAANCIRFFTCLILLSRAKFLSACRCSGVWCNACRA